MRPDGLASRAELALACLRRIAAATELDEARRFLHSLESTFSTPFLSSLEASFL